MPDKERHVSKDRRLVGAALLFALLTQCVAPAAAELKRYDTRYYIIYTDIPPEAAREAALRMTRMAEEYYARTREFAGAIRQKFPFYLYSRAEDYYAAGGPPGSGGVFMVRGDEARLMAIAGEKTTLNTWHTVQHEGFHQFAHAVIGGELPVWANEGLAEYFGESIFTGDGFVTGVVPPYRLERIKDELTSNTLRPIRTMMLMTSEEWAKDLSIENYDQAWTMVYFLVQGEGGKYQKAFTNFMQRVGRGQSWEQSWLATLGPADEFEPRWKAYWTHLPASPTSDLYAQATTATLTSFLARAVAGKQTFANFDAFKAAAATEDGLKISAENWLPHSMLQSALRAAEQSGTWALESPPGAKPPILVDRLEDGARVTGTFALRGQQVLSVTTDVDLLPRALLEAAKLADEGRKPEARATLLEAIRRYPRSPSLPEARKSLSMLR